MPLLSFGCEALSTAAAESDFLMAFIGVVGAAWYFFEASYLCFATFCTSSADAGTVDASESGADRLHNQAHSQRGMHKLDLE